jgi:TetR/AcrR family transcriptional repressor of nem operon
MTTKSERTRAAIVDAARSLIYHKGFEAASYADIGEQTGLGKGNIHYHFRTKEALLESVVEARLTDGRRLLADWDSTIADPFERLQRFISMFEDNAEDLSLYGCPMGSLNEELGKTRKAERAVARRMFDLFLDWLERNFAALDPGGDARGNSEILMSMAQGTSLLAHAYGDPSMVMRQGETARRWLAQACGRQG